MDLPNYFLADLPPEAELSPGMIREACQTLKRNRARYFVDRSTRGLVELLCGVARDWLDPEFPLRKEALAKGPIKLGLSGRTLTLGLEAFFQQWTEAGFKALIEQDLGEMQKLHGFSAAEPEQKAHRASLAKGPLLAAHITAGNLPWRLPNGKAAMPRWKRFCTPKPIALRPPAQTKFWRQFIVNCQRTFALSATAIGSVSATLLPRPSPAAARDGWWTRPLSM